MQSFLKNSVPFEELIDFARLKNESVLEIGVGNGSHAQLLSSNCKDFIGIDLTAYGVESSSKRMEVFSIDNAKILQMNAEELSFGDGQFDFVWSWGVVHHSANTSRIIRQINRVLKPEGHSTIMVYHRGYFNFYFVGFLLHGIIKGVFLKTWSLHRVVQIVTDGAIAKYYKPSELCALLEQAGLVVDKVSVYGNKVELLPLPPGKIKGVLSDFLPNRFSRFLTHHCRMGSMLVATFHKPK